MKGRGIGIGFRRWKAYNLGPILAQQATAIRFVDTVAAAARLNPGREDWLFVWGATMPPGLRELSTATGAPVLRIEDGFVRSVGLGSDLIPPMSLVLDRQGIYFDATHPSDLEALLQNATFRPGELEQAQRVRTFIVAHGITKYNLEPRHRLRWPSGGRRVVLVPGQVETDASIALGAGTVRTNLALLEAARASQPDAFIVYKPHPDVMSGNRRGRLALAAARSIADHIETEASIVSCIDACDEVHTMTSLSGFDALLRNKHVVTWGQPFYAGWGLTDDRFLSGEALARRTRKLTLDEMVAVALLQYPIYWDPDLKRFSDCETIISKLSASRDKLEAEGRLEQLRSGFVRRQARKVKMLATAWLGRARP